MFVCFPFVLGALCHLFNKRIFDWNYINCTSGVFRILVRGKGAVGADKGAVWRRRLGSSAEKSLSMGGGQCAVGMCILTQFLTNRKHGQSLEAFGHGFYSSIAKWSLQKQCKNIQKIAVRPKGGGEGRSYHRPPLVYAI